MQRAATALQAQDAQRLRRAVGWTVFVAGALHGLSQALPLLTRGF
ncbi:hypothetical protein [Azohydromonas lata]|nr:hypothetical protein [Azohydromonas lata]